MTRGGVELELWWRKMQRVTQMWGCDAVVVAVAHLMVSEVV